VRNKVENNNKELTIEKYILIDEKKADKNEMNEGKLITKVELGN
jgi:hypothetical protein